MLRNYLAAALRNLARNRLHSAITTLSLALGFAALILGVLYYRYEHSFDRFWPGHERLYTVSQWLQVPKMGPMWADTAPTPLAPQIAKVSPGIEQVSRRLSEPMRVKSDRTEALEQAVSWVDLNFFEVLQPKVIAGDLKTALRPGSLTLTRSMADKYFGRTDVVGQTLLLTRTGAIKETMPMQVGAVLEDLPTNSHIKGSILVAVRNRSRLDNNRQSAITYLKVREGVTEASLEPALKTLSDSLPPVNIGRAKGRPELRLTPLKYVYLPPKKYRSDFVSSNMEHGNAQQANTYLILGIVILGIAAINFITLMTARGARRAVEVGVRKAAGARRRDLVIQFMGEGLLYTALALLIALALVEFLLPLAAANTGKPLTFDYLSNLGFIAALIAGAAGVGLLAGLYPALALSGFKPAAVLKGGLARTPGSARLRQILIGFQFTPLLVLAAWSTVLFLQAHNAYQNSLKMAPPDALLVRETCTPGLRSAFAAIPGVARVSCLEMNGNIGLGPKGRAAVIGVELESAQVVGQRESEDIFGNLWNTLTDREALEFYGLQPIVGRLWSGPDDTRGVIINEDAAKKLGFARPAGAIGKTVTMRRSAGEPPIAYSVIGVVPNRGGVSDFQAMLYYPIAVDERENPVFGLTLNKDADVPATLAAVDRAFAATGATQPARRTLYRDQLSDSFAGQRRQLQFLFSCVVVGVAIAAFGLFGLAAFLAEQRTKEIGVRKALGANRSRLLQMLVFQFSKPVVMANVLAIPLVFAFFTFMERDRPAAFRTEIDPVIFAPVVLGSLLVALIATFGHAWQVTGERPVKALRYE